MGVKDKIIKLENEISSLRENRKLLQKEATHEQKLALYKKICSKLKPIMKKINRRLFFLGFKNKELKRKLYVIADSSMKCDELLEDESKILELNEKGEEEDLLEFSISIKQLEKKLKLLDTEILEKAKLLKEVHQKPLYAEIGAMLTLRQLATLLIMLEREIPSMNLFLEKLEKECVTLSETNTMSPLHEKNRHRPTNDFFPL